jgi:hypothetical protein
MYCRWKIAENADSDAMRCIGRDYKRQDLGGLGKSGTRISALPLVPESQISRPRRPHLAHSFDPTAWSLVKKFLVVTCRDTCSATVFSLNHEHLSLVVDSRHTAPSAAAADDEINGEIERRDRCKGSMPLAQDAAMGGLAALLATCGR